MFANLLSSCVYYITLYKDKGQLEGTAACALNAANEIAVASFLNDEIGFLDISMVNQKTMRGIKVIQKPELKDYVAVDKEAREFASNLIKNI